MKQLTSSSRSEPDYEDFISEVNEDLERVTRSLAHVESEKSACVEENSC